MQQLLILSIIVDEAYLQYVQVFYDKPIPIVYDNKSTISMWNNPRQSIFQSSITFYERKLQMMLWSWSIPIQKKNLLIIWLSHFLENSLNILGKDWALFLSPSYTNSSLKRKRGSSCIFSISWWSCQVHKIHMEENYFFQEYHGERGRMLLYFPLRSKGE